MNFSAISRCGFLVALGVLLTGKADVVTEWNQVALNAIRETSTPPTLASRNLAILHASIYDAVNGISRTHNPYFVSGIAPASASKEAAASTAAHRVLTVLFPDQMPSLDTLHAATLASIPDRPQKKLGQVWGQKVADRILAWRANDGWDATVPPPDGDEPGLWQPTPPAYAEFAQPQWAFLECFAMTDPTQFRPPPPLDLVSAEYAADYNEVKTFGAAVGSVRSPEQSEIAVFWADPAGTVTPPAHWNRIAQDVSAAQGTTMEENARLFALLNLALADAAICAWDAKYHYNCWRPITAILNGDIDGNDATVADLSWASFLITPAFPDHVSGHSTFSGAAATVLALFYNTDHISFSTGSDLLPGVLRSYDSFSEAADEAALSRLYGGIHFRFAIEDGLTSGLGVGHWTFSNNLEPQGRRARVGAPRNPSWRNTGR